MNTTLNEALAEGEKGNWNNAWNIARRDESLVPGVEKERWIRCAKLILQGRELMKRMESIYTDLI